MKYILFLLLLSVSIIYGQQELIPYGELARDFDSLVVLIEKTHPEPYMPFGGKMAFHRKIQEIRSQIPSDGMTVSDFYFLLSGFISKLHDGHTYISFPGQTASKEEKLLPVKFTISADGLFIKEAQPQYVSLNGCKLLEVNGITVEKLLDNVQLLEPCENIYGSYLVLRKILSANIYVKRLFPDSNTHLKCGLISPSGEVLSVSFEYMEEKELKEWTVFASYNIIQNSAALFSYQYIDDDKKITCFTLNGTYSREVFEIMKAQNMDYKQTLENIYSKYFSGKPRPANDEEALAGIPSLTETFWKMLSEMKENKSTHLIIDLRMNGGGWTSITIPTLYMLYGDKYFSYNHGIEYNTLISNLWLKKYNITIDEYNGRNNSSYKIGDYRFGYFMAHDISRPVSQLREEYINSLLSAGQSGAELLKGLNGEPLYTPKIIVITSPITFSAAFHYAYMLKNLGNSVIVGTPSRQAGNTGMETTAFTLAYSHISGSISNTYQLFFPNDFEKGKTLQPDYLLEWNDYKKYNFDKETEILYTLDLIKKGSL